MIKLTDILQEVLPSSGSLNEDKLYGKKIIDATTNRIGDKSDATLNKLAIAGLFRNQFGDIQKLKDKKQLDDVFNKWYKSILGALVKTSAFPDNKELAKKYLDAYIENVRALGDEAKPFSIKKVEGGLVDLVNNKRWLGDEVVSKNAGIYDPDDEDIVYEDDDILILDSKTKAKCVKYGAGESWCIGKPTLNYYNSYRLNQGATPYHVLQKKVEGAEHKLVILNYGNRGYAIADRSNSGERGGGSSSATSWDKIEAQLPNLNGKEQYFPYRAITKEERDYASLLSKKYTGGDLQGYIEIKTDKLVVNGSKVEAVDFIRDYVANGHALTDRQLASLSDDVKDSLVEAGYFLNMGVNQTGVLNDRQKKRVIRLKLENKIALTEDELNIIKNDSGLMDTYRSAVKTKLNDFLNAGGSYSKKKYKLTYGELLVLDSSEISAYINEMDDTLIRLFLRDEGLDKLAFLNEYGGDNKSVKAIGGSYKALKDADEDTLNELLPFGIKVEIIRDKIVFENLDSNDIDSDITDLLNRLGEDSWSGSYYDDYYDGDEDRLNDDYIHYINQAMANDADFAKSMVFYQLGATAEEIGKSFDDYGLKDDIIDTIKEVVNEASEDAKQDSWRKIHDAAFDIIRLDCGYRTSNCELILNVDSFILSGGYMLFELEDATDTFYGNLDTILEKYLDLYGDKIPTNSDQIWEDVNDYNMTPNNDKITDFIIETGDEMIEKINDGEDGEDGDDAEGLLPIDLVITKFKDTLKGLKYSEDSDYIENKLVKIQFDKRRLRRDNSVFVKMLDKTNNKTTEGYMKIDDIPVYFTNYKLPMGESVRASLRKALFG
jgi:hypothetical protein